MNALIELQKLLQNRFEESKQKNPKYSLRAFSNKLGLSSSSLSEILNGKRNVSKKLALKISQKLDLNPLEEQTLLTSFNEPKKNQNQNKEYLKLNMDHYKLITEWYHFGIRQLIKTINFKKDPKWIADRLGISIKDTTEAIERLLRLEVIQKDKKGNLTTNKSGYKTTDGILNFNLQRAHKQTLEMAIESLHKNSIEERDFISMTVAINPLQIKKAKEKIRETINEMNSILTEGEKSEVYEFTMCLFPLTKLDKGV